MISAGLGLHSLRVRFAVPASGLVSHPANSKMISDANFTTRASVEQRNWPRPRFIGFGRYSSSFERMALQTRVIHRVKLLVTLRCDHASRHCAGSTLSFQVRQRPSAFNSSEMGWRACPIQRVALLGKE